MRFIKGAIIGGIVTTGLVMLYKETNMDKKKLIKKGRKILRRMI